jgi:hypothetical protein
VRNFSHNIHPTHSYLAIAELHNWRMKMLTRIYFPEINFLEVGMNFYERILLLIFYTCVGFITFLSRAFLAVGVQL